MNDEIREILYVLKHIVIGRASRLTCREADRLLDYITNLQKENEDYKSRVEKAIEDIVFCFMSIKQEADMSKDKRTRHEMRTCLAIFNETLKSLKNGSDDNG